MTKRLVRTGLLCVLLAASLRASKNVAGQQPPPISKTYILSQATCPPADSKSIPHVPLGATVQVQLPGNRAPGGTWEIVAPFPKNMKLTSTKIIDSKGRIPGLNSIYIFSFAVTSPGKATITMRAKPALSVTYPDLKNPDAVMCPRPRDGSTTQTYKLGTLTYSLIVD